MGKQPQITQSAQRMEAEGLQSGREAVNWSANSAGSPRPLTLIIRTDSFAWKVWVWSGSRLLCHSLHESQRPPSHFVKGPEVQFSLSLLTIFTQGLTPLVSHSLFWTWTDRRPTRGDAIRYSQWRGPVTAEAVNNQGLQQLIPMFIQHSLDPLCKTANCNKPVGGSKINVACSVQGHLSICFTAFIKTISDAKCYTFPDYSKTKLDT